MLRLALAHRDALPRSDACAMGLQAGETARLATLRSEQRRDQFLAGRTLLRQLTGTLSPEPPDIDPDGRSVLPHLHANLSHSGAWLLAGVADRRVGVDLEQLRPRRGDVLALAAQVHTASQCAQLAHLMDDDPAEALAQFYRWWTMKEAWLKCRGQGLDMALMRRLSFDACAPGTPVDTASGQIDAESLMLAVAVEPASDQLPAELPNWLGGQWVRWNCYRGVLLESRPTA